MRNLGSEIPPIRPRDGVKKGHSSCKTKHSLTSFKHKPRRCSPVQPVSGQQPQIFVESRRFYWLLGKRVAVDSFLEYFQSLRETIRGREHGVANTAGCLLIAFGIFQHAMSFHTADLCLKIAELEQQRLRFPGNLDGGRRLATYLAFMKKIHIALNARMF